MMKKEELVDDVFEGMGVLIDLKKESDFLVVQETLTRIGYPEENKLFQACHIFHKRGQYAIFHYKEMLAFDKKNIEISDEDVARRNSIAELLEQWNIVDIVDTNLERSVRPVYLKEIVVVPSKNKQDWTLIPRYKFGAK